jgi:hypothetical protein
VAFTRSGKHAHSLRTDLKTALGSWVVFASGDVLEKALVYLGMTSDQLEKHRDGMRRLGRGTSKVTIQPHWKNLLWIDYRRLRLPCFLAGPNGKWSGNKVGTMPRSYSRGIAARTRPRNT